MNSNQTDAANTKFETDVKPSNKQAAAGEATTDTANKRYDHHLIDQDLELEDKNGRRLNPKAQEDLE